TRFSRDWSSDVCSSDLLGRDDVNLEAPLQQRGGDLEADEARADDHGAPRSGQAIDDRAAVSQRAQHVNIRLIRAGNVEAYRLGAGREQEAIVRQATAVAQRDRARPRIDLGNGAAETNVDRSEEHTSELQSRENLV